MNQVGNPMGKVYILTSPSGKSYIGQTIRSIERRFEEHQKESSGCVAIYNAIKFHGWENFETDWYECPDNVLDKHEELMIEVLGTLAPDGYNLKSGGSNGKHSDESNQKNRDAHLGKMHTEETKQKMSESQRGKTLSDKTKQKMSEAKLGKTKSEETRGKMSESQRGKTLSDETKQKMSEAQRGEKNHYSKRVYQYDLEGNLLGSYGSCEEAGRHLEKRDGTKISKCACGKQKTAYSFKWSYENNM